MCGIFCYSGKNATHRVFTGLKNLDYRGYDSWGIAVADHHRINIHKQTGIIGGHLNGHLNSGSVAIGHTRWATHGRVTVQNAHPHLSSNGTFALAHNGIVENHDYLKTKLKLLGHSFVTQTDTEVIVRLIEDHLKAGTDLATAFRQAFLELEGRNTAVLVTKAGRILGAKNGSPLVVGLTKNPGEIYLSSDTLSFADWVHSIIVLEDLQSIDFDGALRLTDLSTGSQLSPNPEKLTFQKNHRDKAGFSHFMLKEIHESPQVIRQLLKQDQTKLKHLAKLANTSRHVYCLGSGTAGIAASQIAFYLRTHAGINATGLVGAEADSYYHLFGKRDLLIAPSQSGETADVLEVLELARRRGAKLATFVNMPGSMMTRIADFSFMAGAGPEICVMSTKIFTSQIAWGYLLAKTAAGQYQSGASHLRSTATAITKLLRSKRLSRQLKTITRYLMRKPHIFLLSKSQNLSIVREGMVKLIEGSYKHAHAIPAGDLKHYAITLMEPGVPVIFVISEDEVKDDILNAVSEIKARGASVIALAPFSHPSFDYHLTTPNLPETSAISGIIPIQLLAYHLSCALGNNVDKPRHIAKSVTVK